MNKKNEPFKYIGDDYLILHDTLNKLNMFEQVIFNISNGGILMSEKETQYIIGGDKILRRSAEYYMAINRVINSNPDKYTKIYSCKDPRYPQPRRIPVIMPDNKITSQKQSYIN